MRGSRRRGRRGVGEEGGAPRRLAAGLPPPAVELERKEGEGKDGASGLGLPGYSISYYVGWAVSKKHPSSIQQVSDLF